MNTHHWHVSARTFVLAAMLLTVATHVCADVVTEANEQAAIVTAKVPATPVAVRTMAIVQVSVFEAVNAITGRYPPLVTKLEAAPGASVDAAVAAATRAVLENLAPLQQTAIRADYNSALQKLPDGEAKTAGIAVGEQAAAAVIAARVDDGTTTP